MEADPFRHRMRVSTFSGATKKLIDMRELNFEKLPFSEASALREFILAATATSDARDRADTDRPTRHVVTMGYYAIGHQFKGKKHRVDNEEDLTVMYTMHDNTAPGSRRSTIFMWADLRTHAHTEQASATTVTASQYTLPSSSPGTNGALAGNNMASVDNVQISVVAAGKSFSEDQLQVLANNTTLGNAELSEPPKKRVYNRRSTSTKSAIGEMESSALLEECVTSPTSSASVDRKLQRRDRLFKQLREAKELQVMGAIDEEEFVRQRSNILKDLHSMTESD